MMRRAGYTAITLACLLLSGVTEYARTAQLRIVCLRRGYHREFDRHYVGGRFCIDCRIEL